MMIRRLTPLGLALLLLSGCATLEPRYDRPAPPVPAVFPNGGAYPAASGDAAVLVGWRAFFTGDKLGSVIGLALQNNRDLRIAIANIEAARAQYRVRRADLLPTLSVGASASFNHGPDVRGGSTDSRSYSIEGGTTAFELDLFGRVRSLSKAALSQYLATEQARGATQIALISEVAATYLQLDADQRQLQIAQETLNSGSASLTLTQRRLAGGIASALDVAQAQTIVEQARFDIARYTKFSAQDRNALDLLVGAPTPQALLPTVQDDERVTVPDLPAGVSSAILLQRPDVLDAENQLKAQNANIGAARAAFFPTVSITGTGGLVSAALSTLFTGGAGAWSFIPSISAPIFDAGRNRANLAYARAQRDIATARYERTIQTAFREVADALAQRGSINGERGAQEALVSAAERTLELSDARYTRGSDTYLNVLVAQRTAYAARQSLTNTRLVERQNLVTLYRALGGGLG